MESRKSSRLRLAVNDSGKQRLTRFIKRNLDLIESNVCLKRANSVKNCSRRNSNETPRSQERANYSTKKEDSTKPLRITSSSEIPDLTKRESDFLNKPDKNSIKTESKWVRSESSEPLKNVRKPLRKPTAIPPPEKLNSSTRPAWRLVSDGSSKNKDRTLNNTILSKRKAHPSAGNLKQKDGKAGMPSRQSDLATKKMDVSSIASNSSGRRVIEPEESKSYPIVSNSRSKYIQIQIDSDSNSPTRNMFESSIRTSSFAGNAFVTANTSNSSIRNVEVPSRKSSSSSVNALTSSKKFPQTSSSAEGTSVSANKSNSPADNSESDSEALELKSESSSRKPDSPATISTGRSEELKSFAKSNSPAANSVILITDSDSCSVNAVDSSQSESYDSSLRDSDEDTSKSDPSGAKPLSPNKSVDFTKPDSNAFSNRMDSLSRKSSAPSGKPAASNKKPDSPTKSECTAAPIPFNSTRKPLDLHSKRSSEIEEPGQEEECEKKWNGIRGSLRIARQKIKTKSAQAATSTNKYKYEGILDFLVPHLAERKGLSNVTDEEDDDDAPETGNESQQQNSIQETQQPQDVSNADESEDTTEPSSLPPATTPANRVSAEKRPSYAGRKRKLVNTEVKSQQSASSQLMAFILAQKQADLTNKSNSQSQNFEQHPVDDFLAGIAPPLKSLDPVRLLAAKGTIFNVVQEYELQQLRANSQQRTTMAYIPPSTLSAQTSSASTPVHNPLSEEDADVDGPPHPPSQVAPKPKPPAIITEEDTNLSFFQF